jgi:hypothetical protein
MLSMYMYHSTSLIEGGGVHSKDKNMEKFVYIIFYCTKDILIKVTTYEHKGLQEL